MHVLIDVHVRLSKTVGAGKGWLNWGSETLGDVVYPLVNQCLNLRRWRFPKQDYVSLLMKDRRGIVFVGFAKTDSE